MFLSQAKNLAAAATVYIPVSSTLRRAALGVLCTLPYTCLAQQTTREPALPEAPHTSGTATLRGTVQDESGSLLPGARVEVFAADKTLVVTADSEGEFEVDGLEAGPFTLHVIASGFLEKDESGTLKADELKQLEPVELRMAAPETDVDVVATAQQIATAQVALEEKQRVLGFIPNFYVVYFHNPAPLTKREKFHLAWRSTVDPMSWVLTGVSAGVEQATDSFPGYGQGADGYFKRYGASFTDGAVSTFLGGAVLPVLFRQDPRYYYQGMGTVASRLRHAALSVVVTHGDSGKLQFNYSNVLGNFASAGISNLYYPASDRNGAGLTLRNAAVGTAFGAFGAVMQEFVVRKLTPHLPSLKKLPPP